MKRLLKRHLPKWLNQMYNQLISRRLIRRRYGGWLQIEWKREAGSAPARRWVEVYDDSWRHWSGSDIAPDDIQRIAALVAPNSTTLDVGCGSGDLLKALKIAPQNCWGVDISTVALKLARANLSDEAKLVQAFAERLPFAAGSFDIVLCAHTLEHIRHMKAAVGELKRVARKRLIILVPCQEYVRYSEDYHLNYFPDEQSLLDAVGLPHAQCARYRNPPGDWTYQGDLLLLTAELK